MAGMAPNLSATLYLVATPIGTASDITLRALDILAHGDVLVAEDKRQLLKLMDIHGIKLNGRPLLAYHDHSSEAVRARLVGDIKAGKSVVYVSDAGTPLIADPGFKLAQDVRRAGLGVTAAPGASAVLSALVVAGLPTDRFLFGGFPPTKTAARQRFLAEFASTPATLVFYENPKRLSGCFADMAQMFGPNRPAAMCRELTKKFEEVRHGTLAELAQHYDDAPAPKGEAVIVVGPPEKRALTDAEIDAALLNALQSGSVKDAAGAVAAMFDLPRKPLYQRALHLVKS